MVGSRAPVVAAAAGRTTPTRRWPDPTATCVTPTIQLPRPMTALMTPRPPRAADTRPGFGPTKEPDEVRSDGRTAQPAHFGDHPHLQRTGEPAADPRSAVRGATERARAHRRRRQPRRHWPARRRAGSR